jgi:hypothetical protein
LSPKSAEQTQPIVEEHLFEEEESAYEDEVADAKQQKEQPPFKEARATENTGRPNSPIPQSIRCGRSFQTYSRRGPDKKI